MKTAKGLKKGHQPPDCVMLLSGHLNPRSTFFSESLHHMLSLFKTRPNLCSEQGPLFPVLSAALSLSLSLYLSPPAGAREIMACCIAVSGVIRLCGVAAPSLWRSCPLQGGWGPIAYTPYSDRAAGDWQQHGPVWDWSCRGFISEACREALYAHIF